MHWLGSYPNYTLSQYITLTQNKNVVDRQSKSSTEIPKLRQPIKIEYQYAEKPPESSRLGWKALIGSRIHSVRYSLS